MPFEKSRILARSILGGLAIGAGTFATGISQAQGVKISNSTLVKPEAQCPETHCKDCPKETRGPSFKFDFKVEGWESPAKILGSFPLKIVHPFETPKPVQNGKEGTPNSQLVTPVHGEILRSRHFDEPKTAHGTPVEKPIVFDVQLVGNPLQSSPESELARLRNDVAVLKAEIAKLKGGSKEDPSRELVQKRIILLSDEPERKDVLIERKVESPNPTTYRVGQGFAIRMEVPPTPQNHPVTTLSRGPGQGGNVVEIQQVSPQQIHPSAKAIEAIMEGLKDLPPATRLKVIEALHGVSTPSAQVQTGQALAGQYYLPPASQLPSPPIPPPSGQGGIQAYWVPTLPPQMLAPAPSAIAPQSVPYQHPSQPMFVQPKPVQPGISMAPVAVDFGIPIPPVTVPVNPTPSSFTEPKTPGLSGIDQKLNKIMEKLEKLEKRLDAKEATRGAIFITPPPSGVPSSQPVPGTSNQS